MKVLKKENKFCISCMEKHEVLTIAIMNEVSIKGMYVTFEGIYDYCEHTDETWATEEMINENSKRLIEEYKLVKNLVKKMKKFK